MYKNKDSPLTMALPLSVYVPKHLNFSVRDIFKNLNIHCVILCSCENHDRGLSTKIYIHKEGKMNTGLFSLS